MPEKVKGHKKISEIPDVPKAIANLTIPLLTACRKREFRLPGFVFPTEAVHRVKLPSLNREAMPLGLWLPARRGKRNLISPVSDLFSFPWFSESNLPWFSWPPGTWFPRFGGRNRTFHSWSSEKNGSYSGTPRFRSWNDRV